MEILWALEMETLGFQQVGFSFRKQPQIGISIRGYRITVRALAQTTFAQSEQQTFVNILARRSQISTRHLEGLSKHFV
jgi:hypothetical protein